ncbi:hypothetical protein KSW98_11385, partial [Streptococcus pneumoniae]
MTVRFQYFELPTVASFGMACRAFARWPAPIWRFNRIAPPGYSRLAIARQDIVSGNEGLLSSNSEHRFYQGLAATFVANCLQATNFLSDRFLRRAYYASAKIDELYR